MNSTIRNVASDLKMRLKSVPQELKFRVAKKDKKFNPVFLIGCGRSGTTILGQTLGKHPDVTYLNERRDLWHMAYPELDIWSGKLHAKLYLNRDNIDVKKSQRLKRLFYREQAVEHGELVLEKLPINNFRLDFINGIFPQAKFIYLHRNGLEVARSISRLIKKGWFGKKNMKLDFLYNYAKRKGIPVPEKEALSDINKGLLEWRLSIEESDQFFNKLSLDRYISLSYQSLLEEPTEKLRSIFDFLELDSSKTFAARLGRSLERKNQKITHTDKVFIRELGGEFLIPSIKDRYRRDFPNSL